MERRMRRKSHVRCGVGENLAMTSNGYLSLFVGTTDRWNDAKKSEEHERVKHNVLAGI